MSIVGLEFEWDTNKARRNMRIHRVDFVTATRVFADPNRIEFYDVVHSDEEDRYTILGLADNVLFVVYTQRVNRVRIISARLATKREQEVYWNGNGGY